MIKIGSLSQILRDDTCQVLFLQTQEEIDLHLHADPFLRRPLALQECEGANKEWASCAVDLEKVARIRLTSYLEYHVDPT